MTSSENLGQMLAGSLAEGEYHSEGQFTMDGQTAYGKLAVFQLPRASAWILKIVQAAVSSGAPSLKIRQMKRVTTFDFQPADMALFASLEESLGSHELKGLSSVQQLTLGLRAVSIGQGRSFTLALSQEGRKTVYHSDGTSLTRVDSRIKEGVTGVSLSVEVGETGGPLSFRSRLTLEERTELERGCQACPIAVTCDNRRLDTLAFRESEPKQDQAVLSLAWRANAEADTLPSFGLPQGMELTSRWRPTDRLWDKRIFLVDGSQAEREVRFVARLTYHYKIKNYGTSQDSDFSFESYGGPSFVHWVLDGVVASSEQLVLPEHPSVRLELFLSADGLPTDLSGLVPTESAQHSQRLVSGLRAGVANFPRLLESLRRHSIRPVNLPLLGNGAFITLHGIAMAIGFKGLTLPFHGYAAYSIYREMASRLGTVRDDCVENLEALHRLIGVYPQES